MDIQSYEFMYLYALKIILIYLPSNFICHVYVGPTLTLYN